MTHSKRLNYIDNLRSLTVSLLIIYHLAMAYNTWGEPNYIFLGETKFFSAIVVLISPWFMPLMFLLAGIGTFYSLKKRSFATFIKERLIRLGIPFVFGMLIINPMLSFVADVTHNGYQGNILSHYGIYFTRFTDLSGYDGGFTLGHLWFVIVLIVISILSSGIIKLCSRVKSNAFKFALNATLVVVAILAYNFKSLGKPLITYLCVFLLGYFLFSNQEFVNRLTKFKWLFTCLFIGSAITNTVLFVFVGKYELLNNICNYLAFVTGIPALFCLGNEYLNFTNSICQKCSRLSYVFYIVHFPVVILCQYYASQIGLGIIANFFVGVIAATVVTALLCLIIDTNPITRVLFGLKNK